MHQLSACARFLQLPHSSEADVPSFALQVGFAHRVSEKDAGEEADTLSGMFSSLL
jgi:hypothetical protein